MKDINILILSSGTRNKIVQYFKKELKGRGRVFAADASKLAPSLYDADDYFIVPRIDDENYLTTILDICKDYQIDGLLSLIDPELSIISANKEKFIEIGTTPIISDPEVIELCFDKYQFNEYIKKMGMNYIKSYINLKDFYQDYETGLVDFPVFVKPNKGSASININKVLNLDDLEKLFNKHNNLIIQEFIDGKEYGVDVYIDMHTGKLTSMFIKEKLLMRAGETDKSVSVLNDDIFNLVNDFVKHLKPFGVIDVDIFERDGEFYISEINPRFGGGYPHAYECGVNVPNQIIDNLMGIRTNAYNIDYESGKYMLKYSEINII